MCEPLEPTSSCSVGMPEAAAARTQREGEKEQQQHTHREREKEQQHAHARTHRERAQPRGQSGILRECTHTGAVKRHSACVCVCVGAADTLFCELIPEARQRLWPRFGRIVPVAHIHSAQRSEWH